MRKFLLKTFENVRKRLKIFENIRKMMWNVWKYLKIFDFFADPLRIWSRCGSPDKSGLPLPLQRKTEDRRQKTGGRILDTRCLMLDSGCSILDAWCSILDVRYSMGDFGQRNPREVVGRIYPECHSSRDSKEGGFRLTIYYWRLAILVETLRLCYASLRVTRSFFNLTDWGIWGRV